MVLHRHVCIVFLPNEPIARDVLKVSYNWLTRLVAIGGFCKNAILMRANEGLIQYNKNLFIHGGIFSIQCV